MLDPNLWDLLPDGNPKAIFPRSLASVSMGEQGVLLLEYAETPDQLQTGPYKKIQIYMNRQLAEHFQTHINATFTGQG